MKANTIGKKLRGNSSAPEAKSRARSGAACVELAVCLPVVVLLTFASLEGANMLFMRQAAVQSAYEACKAAGKTNGSTERGRQLATQVLAARRIGQANITYTPANVEDLDAGTPFTVTVTFPGDQRSVTGVGPFNGLNISASATMHRE